MSLRQLLRKRRSPSSFSHPSNSSPPCRQPFYPPRRFQSSSPNEATTRARIDRVLNRLPRFLHPYTNGLRNAPVSHIVSFLILHEITAIVPLVGLAGLFHYSNWLPRRWVEGRWVSEGMERFGRYFGRKGWFGFERVKIPARKDVTSIQTQTPGSRDVAEGEKLGEGSLVEEMEKKWHVGEKGSRILIEVATAYAITKVFLPARILLSVWATPWFARVVIGRVGGLFGRRGAVGKGAVGNAAARAGLGKGGGC